MNPEQLYKQQQQNEDMRKAILHYEGKAGYEELYNRAKRLLKRGERIEKLLWDQMNIHTAK